MEEIILNVPSDTKRLDAYIAENTELSRSRATKLIEEGLDVPLSFTCYPHEQEWLLSLRKRINEEIRNNM